MSSAALAGSCWLNCQNPCCRAAAFSAGRKGFDPVDGGIGVASHPGRGDRGKHVAATLAGRHLIQNLKCALRVGGGECADHTVQGVVPFAGVRDLVGEGNGPIGIGCCKRRGDPVESHLPVLRPLHLVEFGEGSLRVFLGPQMKERLVLIVGLGGLHLGCQHLERPLGILRRRIGDEGLERLLL